MHYVILVVFFGLGALILASAAMVVVVKNVIHAALWLTASFLGVAGLYLLMEAEFLGVVQVLIYAGAISILVLFAIMLTRHVTGEGERQLYERWWVSLLVAALLFGALLTPVLLRERQNFSDEAYAVQQLVLQPGQPVPTPAPVQLDPNDPLAPPVLQQPVAAPLADTRAIGVSFMREFLLPFEVASILLLVALVGAIVIAYEERARTRRVLTLAEQVLLRKSRPVEPAIDKETALSPAGQEGT